MLNPFFTQGTGNEQTLVQNLIDEHIKMHGIEFTYLPRQFVNVKTIMREVTTSKFTKSCPIEGYIQNYDGFGDNHNILTKFGVRSTAEMEIVISQRRFEDSITSLLSNYTKLNKAPLRPLEGDLIYFPLGDMLFEIKYVDHEHPSFYQLQNNYTYLLKCELFEYEDEVISTGINDIDDNFKDDGYDVTLNLLGAGTTAAAITSVVNGAVNRIRILNEGTGYTRVPIVRIEPPTVGVGASAVAITTSNQGGTKSIQEIYIINPGFGYTFVPNIFIEPTDGRGFGASAIAGIGTTGSIGIVTITDSGTKYTSIPTVTFSPPPSLGGVTAIGTAILNNSNELKSIRIINAGYGYTDGPPTITVSAAGTIGVGTYRYGDYIRGVSTGTTAFVTNWDEPTLTLNARNLSGKFAVGEIIVGEGTTTSSVAYTLNTITYFDNDDPYSSSEDFQTEGEGILDFTESNPFGEV